MKQFATYEEENIHYWTNRASGYSGVNQEELASSQKTVWRGLISRRIAARLRHWGALGNETRQDKKMEKS